jgi:starch synthase (maltosyl-transferring)
MASGVAGTRDARSSRRPSRVVVENVQPQIDGGRFPIKRTVGEAVFVTADVFADGHDKLAGVLKHRTAGGEWQEVPLAALGNDSWGASFVVTALGEYEYTVEAWIDHFGSWLAALVAKADAGDDVESELLEGAAIVERAAPTVAVSREAVEDGDVRIRSEVRLKPDTTYEAERTTDVVSGFTRTDGGFSRTDGDARLRKLAEILRNPGPQSSRVAAARDPEVERLMRARPDRSASTCADHPLRVIADPVRARFGAWYEMFPRSCTPDPRRGGTLREAESRLPDIAAMGFDVLYLPPVHPIGTTNRKGRNNALRAAPGDPGSPWAIGAEAGGHTAIDPGLGTLDDFDRFVATARHLGLQIALDIAFQASPDHPWTKTHPQWFQRRPDGSIKFAENPPKKYQDIYPFDFGSEDWRALWDALRDVFLFWASHGVTIFRVDNPHTKPFAFWEWVIAEVRGRHPEAIFLSEAFTRPKVMRRLAKLGFNQSYTYFTWRNTAQELREYLTELTRTEVCEYMRPNFFANTPDILHAYLQDGGRPAFEVRLILAAMLSASYGIYSGFELCENVPVRPGSEEYLNSEKYEIRVRNWNQPGNLNERIARVNDIRRTHTALQFNSTLAFHPTDNPALLWFSKAPPAHLTPAGASSGSSLPEAANTRVFVVANTDPWRMQHGHVQVPIWELGLAANQPYVVYDLLDDARYVWHGDWNYVKLDPVERMAHVFVVRTE